MFDPHHEIAILNPAPYNPREIDTASIERLKESIKVLGLVKPVIVTKSGTLLAGHQRTRAMQELGFVFCPAFILPDISTQDEIRFNQLHNASDVEMGDVKLTIPSQPSTGFVEVAPDDIRGSMICKNTAKKQEMLRLLAKFGPWGSMVATQSGEVLVSGVYGICSKMLRLPCLVFIVPDDQRESVLHFFGQSYGKFSYANLPETTWAQSLAQMFRLRSESTSQHSRTYESLVMPRLTKSMRVLDFGAGQMDYVKMLKKRGYSIRGIEFYFRQGAQLNVGQVQRDITALCDDLSTSGLYDLVVCDSVLNSVTSIQAERDVLTCLNAFCKPGGTIIFSGRSRAMVEYEQNETRSQRYSPKRFVQFIDEHGFSAMYANGIWRYQKYHYLADIEQLAFECFPGAYLNFYNFASSHGAPPTPVKREFSSSGWGCVLSKREALPVEQSEASLAREFDLPLPSERRFGRSRDILHAWRIANTSG